MIEYIKNLINNLIVYITTSCQAKLTAGENVTIAYDETTGETIISASGGGGGGGDSIYKKLERPLMRPGETITLLDANNSDDLDFINNHLSENKYIKLYLNIYQIDEIVGGDEQYIYRETQTAIIINSQTTTRYNKYFMDGSSLLATISIYFDNSGSLVMDATSESMITGYFLQSIVNN